PGTTSAPWAARACAPGLAVSRVNARTCQLSASMRRATALPCWPVAPVTAMIFWLMLTLLIYAPPGSFFYSTSNFSTLKYYHQALGASTSRMGEDEGHPACRAHV